jgi:hypothetical protein
MKTFNGITTISREFCVPGLISSLIFSEKTIINIMEGTQICGASQPVHSCALHHASSLKPAENTPPKRQYSSELLPPSVLKKNAADSSETSVFIRAVASLSPEEKFGRFFRNVSAHQSCCLPQS